MGQGRHLQMSKAGVKQQADPNPKLWAPLFNGKFPIYQVANTHTKKTI